VPDDLDSPEAPGDVLRWLERAVAVARRRRRVRLALVLVGVALLGTLVVLLVT
jgi:hypothetical protein